MNKEKLVSPEPATKRQKTGPNEKEVAILDTEGEIARMHPQLAETFEILNSELNSRRSSAFGEEASARVY